MARMKNKDRLVQIIDALTIQNDYLNDYLSIYKSKIEDLKNKKILKYELKLKEELLPFEIAAGIESEYLVKKRLYEVNKVEDKYYWLNRKLKQTKKRHYSRLEKNSIDINQSIIELYNQKQANLLANESQEKKSILDRYIKENDIENKNTYLQKKQEFDNLYLSYEENLNRINNSKYNAFLNKTNKKMRKNQNKIDDSLKRLEEYKLETDAVFENILEIKNLSMSFGGLKAVDDLSFNVKEGEIFGLIGPNGAGKTTVFNCITQFYKATSGDVLFKDKSKQMISLNEYKVHNIINLGIARTFQNVELIWEISVLDNILVGGHSLYQTNFFEHLINSRRLHQEEAVLRQKALDILESLDLIPYKDISPYGLPYGILKRIELARTLITNPRLIILDEPAAGLNDLETEALKDIIFKIRDKYNTTIFLVEHDMGLVMDVCDTVCTISFGKKIAIGTPSDIQQNIDVRTAYLGGE